MSTETLEQLSALIKQRRLRADTDNSYVASLNAKGLDKILSKVTEESLEVALAAKTYQLHEIPENNTHLVNELADLWFHMLVLIDHFNINYQEVLQMLDKRLNKSGIEEKKERKHTNTH